MLLLHVAAIDEHNLPAHLNIEQAPLRMQSSLQQGVSTLLLLTKEDACSSLAISISRHFPFAGKQTVCCQGDLVHMLSGTRSASASLAPDF